MSNGERYTSAHDLLTSAGFDLSPQEENYLKTATYAYKGSGPYDPSAVSNLYSSKLLERMSKQQAKSNDKHARQMTRLTYALVICAAVEAVATLLAALIAAGIIGP
jgi:hypothetical protein